MSGSTLTAFPYIAELSEATPGLWNNVFSVFSQNIAEANSIGTITSQISAVGMVTINADSTATDYIHFHDSSNARSDYLIGSFTTGTADGLNIYDASGQTMIVSFSKQSVRFYQNVVGPVFDVGGALASTYNAATFGTGTQSTVSRIQAAINQASVDGIKRVYVPASMYPYSASSTSFIYGVQMVREGGDWAVFDVWAYGAAGDGTTDDTVAINSAITAAANNTASSLQGGLVYFPGGKYLVTATVNVPVAANQNQVILRGAGMRVTYILASGTASNFSNGAILFGSTSSDPSGTFTFQTQYCGLEDMSVSGTLLSGAGNAVAIKMAEMQKGWIRNCIIEKFQANNSIGLYLRGSSTTAGGPGASAAPHNWRCGFMNMAVFTTMQPLIIENGDENDFYNCNFGCPTGLVSAVTAIQILQGRNNRFFGLLAGGDSSSLTTGRVNYTGVLLTAPANGDNAANQFYGVVSEGFDSGFSIGSGVNNTAIYNHNSSINRLEISDFGATTRTYYVSTGNAVVALFQHPDGSHAGPAFAFRSDGSLGWFKSATSTMALSQTGRLQVGSGAAFSLTTQPEYAFAEADLGLLRSGGSQIDVYSGGVRIARFGAVGGTAWVGLPNGSTTTPAVQFTSEVSTGFYRSGTSQIATAPGTRLFVGSAAAFYTLAAPELAIGFDGNTGISRQNTHNITIGVAGTFAGSFQSDGGTLTFRAPSGSATTAGIGWNSEPKMGFYRSAASAVGLTYGQLQLPAGTALQPSRAYSSESSLGWYRSAASAIALSYGTIDLTGGGAVTSIASLTVKSGANNSCGTAVLGSNGSVNVANTYVKTGDLIFLTDQTPGGTIGDLELGGIRNSSGFTIQSTSVTDTSTVAWLIIRPG